MSQVIRVYKDKVSIASINAEISEQDGIRIYNRFLIDRGVLIIVQNREGLALSQTNLAAFAPDAWDRCGIMEDSDGV